MTTELLDQQETPASANPSPKPAVNKELSDNEFVEQWAKSQAKVGERPYYNVNEVRQFSRPYGPTTFRVSYYDPIRNALSRSWFVDLVKDGQNRECRVRFEKTERDTRLLI